MRRLLAVAVCLLAVPAPAATGAVPEAVHLRPGLEPEAIAAGREGTLWAAGIVDRAEEPVRAFVTRLGSSGRLLTRSRSVLPGSSVANLVRGPEGAMWFTVPKMDEVLRVDDEGGLQSFQMPEGSRPTGLAAFDGRIWVGLRGRSEIATIDPAASEVATYPLRPGTSLTQMARGPDQRLWAIESRSPEFVRFEPDGEADYLTLDHTNPEFEDQPNSDIAEGEGARIWFSHAERGSVEWLKLKGRHLHGAGINLEGGPATMLSAGPDRDMWFADERGKIGSVAPDGELGERSCAVSTCARVRAIAPGPEGGLWFAAGNEVAPFAPRPLSLRIRNVDGRADRVDGKLSIFLRLHATGGAADQICPGRLEVFYRGRRIQRSSYHLLTRGHLEDWMPLDRDVRRLLGAQGRLPVLLLAKVGRRTTARRTLTLSTTG
jgi:virginiamycin B lyase